jgi:predicted lysophospholipase L1 biosynthesis ABC-type transport system permease subunit
LYVHLRVDSQMADPEALLPSVRTAIREVDPDLPILTLATLRDLFDRNPNLWIVRFGGLLFLWLGLAALALALVGIYGVTAFLISRRTREFGVRMALGASRQRLTRQILCEHSATAALGLVIGIIFAGLAGQILSSLLYEVDAADPAVFIVATAVLGAAATLAAWLPVRRASRIEPTAALRYE